MAPAVRSSRLPGDLEPNRLAETLARIRRDGRPILDLTASNPTRVGLDYPADLLAPLADASALTYDPEPFGLLSARVAVAADFARRGLAVGVDRICLAASTSEAYAWLFKLLCEPGDRVLVPRPSYPLFEHLTALECVEVSPYELEADGHWGIDVEAVARQIDDRTRAVLVVSPNNPTGSLLDADEIEALAGACASRGVALIGDEVFADYRLDGGPAPPSVAHQRRALGFALGGLSKSVGLPQVKLAWIALAGPDALVAQARSGLEIIADTFLSVSTPVQVALPALLERGAAVRTAIRARIARNLDVLTAAAAAQPSVTFPRPTGGWCGVVQVPALQGEEALVVELLTRDGVLVHPGYFFDFPREAMLVVSLLPAPATFDQGVARVLSRVAST